MESLGIEGYDFLLLFTPEEVIERLSRHPEGCLEPPVGLGGLVPPLFCPCHGFPLQFRRLCSFSQYALPGELVNGLFGSRISEREVVPGNHVNSSSFLQKFIEIKAFPCQVRFIKDIPEGG